MKKKCFVVEVGSDSKPKIVINCLKEGFYYLFESKKKAEEYCKSERESYRRQLSFAKERKDFRFLTYLEKNRSKFKIYDLETNQHYFEQLKQNHEKWCKITANIIAATIRCTKPVVVRGLERILKPTTQQEQGVK